MMKENGKMKNFNVKRFIIAVLIVAIVCMSVLAVLFGVDKTFSAYVSITVPEGKDVTVYVGGNDVKKSDGKYNVTPASTITVTAVNESKLFKSMTINGVTYETPVVEITVPESNEFAITVETTEPYAEDVGRYFGNPYVLSREADVLSVARILAGRSTAEDFERIGAEGKTADDIRYGYFRLGTNVFISSSEFFGLGFRGGLPFGGCFDFGGYTATINLVRTSHVDDEFTLAGDTHYADYGFFAYAYGDGAHPCLMRNIKTQGFIGLNTIKSEGTTDHTDHVNAGGVAGTAGKNIVFDGIESTVSVSAQTRFANLYIGGVFGLCSSSVESWCDVRYDGAFNDVSGVTYGENSGATVGGFAGVLQNASVNGVTIEGERSLVLANALGDVSGSAIAGGFIGVIELGDKSSEEVSDPRPMIIKDVTIYAESDYSVTAVIDNGDSPNKGQIDPDDYNTKSAAAIAGGIVGIVNRGRKGGTALSDDKTIKFSDIRFLREGETEEDNNDDELVGIRGGGRLTISASTEDGSSSGAVFAGGAVGYIYNPFSSHIAWEIPDATKTDYLFGCPVDISAVQNGVGPAYAGGAFGYNSFHPEVNGGGQMKIGIVEPEYDYTVTASQSATSTKANDKFYNVCAGGYTSRFSVGYDIKNTVFYIGNGRITAYREVGSTAIGDVNAGGIAGRILGYGNESSTITDYDNAGNATRSGAGDNVTVYYSANSRVEASCYSYSSINPTGTLGNNACAGGAIGYVFGYSEINNFSLIYDKTPALSGSAAEYFVSGVQNAKNQGKDQDLKSEGFVGGMFGLVIDTKVKNIEFIGEETENTVVYFTSSNSPNTASVGGLMGALWGKKLSSGTVLLDGATAHHVHVAGRAYSERNTSDDTYDIYVGGVIGVFANPNNGKTIVIKNINVQNCVIEAIGEKAMLPYAGGIVAGMWWSKTTTLSYGIVKNSAVTASSISPDSYAGGIAGLVQDSSVDHCLTQNTEVKAVSEQSNAYAAGIAARAKRSVSIKYSYSNASLKAQGKNGSNKYGILARNGASNDIPTSGAAKNLFVYETAGTDAGYSGDSYKCSLYLASDKQNKASINSGNTLGIYSAIDTNQLGSAMSLKSHETSIATISSLNVRGVSAGVAYISAYCKINNVEYLLCSYPVTVDGATENGRGIAVKTDDGKDASAEKCDALIDYAYGSGTSSVNYTYFRRNIGNPNTIKKIIVSPVGADYLPQNIRFYDISTVTVGKAEYFTEDTTDAEKTARIKAIIEAKGTACDVSAFNGRVNVGYNYENEDEGAAKKSLYFYANDNVRDNTIILMECDYGSAVYGVIVEFVPNELMSISIAPEASTPPLDARVENGVTHYIYTAGDVVRFGATMHYFYPAPRSYVVETIYSGTGVTPNGTVTVASGGVYNVTCKDLKGNASTTVVVEAKKEMNFSFAYSGATGSSDRKMVESCDFSFEIMPQAGYGLYPTFTVTVNGETATGEFKNGGLLLSFNAQSFTFSYKADSVYDYAYTFVATSEFVDYVANNGETVEFSVEYRKIYSLVFISNYGGNEYFYTTVAAGEAFADVKPEKYDEYTAKWISERYGYDFRGFYTINKAGDVSAYGKSFKDMQNDPASVVSGTMRFYARWTYNITVEAPENVKVTSSFAHSMLEGGELIPLDANVGFGFVMSVGDGWCGKPRFDAFIRKSDGTFASITSSFSPVGQENGYYIAPEKLESGYIYLKIYANSLEFAVGDDPLYDGNELYTDGIFTVTYNVNYGSEDSPKDFTFDFAPYALPSETSIRLFYQKNGAIVWVGANTLSGDKRSIYPSDFASMKDNSRFASSVRSSAKTEKFILVVTLPNNTNEFGITAASACTIKVKNYVYKSIISDFGIYSQTAEGAPDTSDGTTVKDFVLYPAVIRSLTLDEDDYNTTTIIFAEEKSLSADVYASVIDHRHTGIRYMWRIEKIVGGYIGTETFDSFGKEVVRTTDAIYYSATPGSVTVKENLSGYAVSLIEARNIQQPAEGFRLFYTEF